MCDPLVCFTYIHAYIHTWVHTHRQKLPGCHHSKYHCKPYIHGYIHVWSACLFYIHTCIHTWMHTYMNTYTPSEMAWMPSQPISLYATFTCVMRLFDFKNSANAIHPSSVILFHEKSSADMYGMSVACQNVHMYVYMYVCVCLWFSRNLICCCSPHM